MSLKKHLQPFERATKLRMNEIMWNNFIGGIFWAMGVTLGLAVIFTGLTLLSKNVNLVPVVGTFVSDVINFILDNNPNVGHPK